MPGCPSKWQQGLLHLGLGLCSCGVPLPIGWIDNMLADGETCVEIYTEAFYFSALSPLALLAARLKTV